MGKKSKKNKLKKDVRAVLKGNKVLFAALGGAAAGLTLAGIFGSEKGKEILNAVEDSIETTAERISNGTFRSEVKDLAKNQQ